MAGPTVPASSSLTVTDGKTRAKTVRFLSCEESTSVVRKAELTNGPLRRHDETGMCSRFLLEKKDSRMKETIQTEIAKCI